MASRTQLAWIMRLLGEGAWAEAEAAARRVMEDDPDDLFAMLLASFATAGQGDTKRAAPLMTRLAAMRPDSDHPCVDLARFQPPLPRQLVSDQFRACLDLEPTGTRLRLSYASFLLNLDQAENAYGVLAAAADSAEACHLRGMAEAETNRYAAATASFRRAVDLNPAVAASWSGLGMMLKVDGRFPEAIEAHSHAVALAPDVPRFRVNRAVTLLKAGDWTRAWTDHDARLSLPGAPAMDLNCLLRPKRRLRGKTVLALHEDGFGDTMQWLRYLPLLAARGARVVVAVPDALVRLVAMVPGVDAVVTDPDGVNGVDYICPMGCLPALFGTTTATVPPPPKLVQDAALVARWAGRLPVGGLRIGLVWAGQSRPHVPGFTLLDQRRSAGLAEFAPLFEVPEVSVVSLQTGPAARQPRPPGAILTDPMPEVTDFADTLAIVSGLDLVIGVDTAVIHLAGLADKPVFLLDRYDGCWRWLANRRDSPWYKRMTIFRQTEPGDWTQPMLHAAEALLAMAIYRGLAPAPRELRERAFVA